MNTTDKPKQPADRARRPDLSTDGLLDRLFAWLDISLVRQAAGELARECHAAVWEATYEKARGMSRDEARGYVRAFAPEFLSKEVDLVLQRQTRARVVAAADPRRGRRTTRSNWSSRTSIGPNRGGRSAGLRDCPDSPASPSCSTRPHLLDSATRLLRSLRGWKSEKRACRAKESGMLVKWPVRREGVHRRRPAAGDGGHPLQQRPVRDVCLPDTGENAFLAGQRTAFGRRNERPRGRHAGHAERGPRHAGRRIPRCAAGTALAASQHGRPAVCRPAWRGGRHPGRVPQSAGPQAPGRRQHGRQPAGTRRRPADRRLPAADPPNQQQRGLGVRRTEAQRAGCGGRRPADHGPQTAHPPALDDEGLCRGSPRAVSRTADRAVDHQRFGGAGFRRLRASLLPLDLPAAGDPDSRLAESGRGRFQLSTCNFKRKTKCRNWPRR